MPKVPLSTITSGYGTVDALNQNFDAIEAAFDNTLSRDGDTPNEMQANLDMNGYNILNQGNPIVVDGLNWRGNWVTATSYKTGDIVQTNGVAYICIVAHTSGVFTTDLTAVRWQVFVQTNLPTQTGNSGKYLSTDGSLASWQPFVVPDGTITTAKLADGVLSADVAGRAKMADGFTTTAKQADGSVTVPKIETSVTARFGLLRNLLLNPSGGAVFQRAVAVAADDAYFADRWYALTELGNVTPSVLTDPEPGYPFGTRLTQSNTTAQRFGFAQIIESRNCKHLRGWSGVLGARVRASGSQTIRYAVLGWTGTEDTVTSDVVNNWSSTSFTAGGFFISSNLSVLAVGSQAVTANTWTSLPDIAASMGTSFNNVIIMVWTESAQAQNFTLDFDWVQFERGSVMTPPDWRGTAEFALCQRYYATIPAGAIAASAYLLSAAGNALYWTSPTPVPMRVSPTIDATTLTYSALNCSGNPSFSAASNSGISASVISAGTGNTFFSGTGGTLRLNAEL